MQFLELRNLMAGDVGVASLPTDGQTTARDALTIINVFISQRESGLDDDVARYDVNGDGRVSPLDVLGVINFLAFNRETPVAKPQRSGDGSLQTCFAQLGERDDILAWCIFRRKAKQQLDAVTLFTIVTSPFGWW
ncbi:MAG: dockerin type I domain-containing protein [Pirellula sp.]